MSRDPAAVARFTVVEAIAVLAGAVIGTLATAVFGWLFVEVAFAAVAAVAANYILALVTVAIFAALYAYLPGTPATLASLAVGIVLPTVVASFAFDSAQPFATLLLLNLVFALVALSVYRFVHASGLARGVAAEVADRR